MFEEVKEMIDSTIYENGRGEVTAKNLNLAMHGVVDAVEEKFGEVNDAVKAVEDKVTALEENGTGGAGALKVWMPVESMSTELTSEQIAENVATYNEIVKGEPVSVILCQGGSVDGKTVAGTIPTTASYTDFGGNKTVVLLANQIVARELVTIMGQLYSDGSVAMFTETFEVPAASNGPLRVWMNDDLTDKQKSENAAAHAAIKNGETRVQILYDYGDGAYEIYELRTIAVMDGLVGFVVSVGITEEHFYETESYILNEDGTLSISE